MSTTWLRASRTATLLLCEIQKGRVNIDETGISPWRTCLLGIQWMPTLAGRSPRAELQAIYEKTTYEDRILLPDRVIAMCR